MDYHPTHHLNLQKEVICMIGSTHNTDPLRNIILSFAVSLLHSWQLNNWSSKLSQFYGLQWEFLKIELFCFPYEAPVNTNDYLKFLLIFLLF